MSTKAELSRITIDIPTLEHKRLKALAAAKGLSMKELIMEPVREKYCCEDLDFNKETKQAMKDAENRKGLVKVKNTKDLFKKLGL